MSARSLSSTAGQPFRQILGVRFFVGSAPEAVRMGSRGGLVVAPAAPALVDLRHDSEYRRALLEADLAITDSGLLVLLWCALMLERIPRVSGLAYLKLLLAKPEFKDPNKVIWVMPSNSSMTRNLGWLREQGYAFSPDHCYVAPKYSKGTISDPVLLKLIKQRQPYHVIICVGGGVQEKLGLYLRNHCEPLPAIHCIGGAIGFLSGDQVRIPDWADRTMLGWFFRCASDPRRFIPRYVRALELPLLLLRYRGRLPIRSRGSTESSPSQHRPNNQTVARSRSLATAIHLNRRKRMNASDELKLDLETTVTCAEGQMAAEVGGGHLALLNLKTGIYYGLDEVGGRIWALLGKSRTVREIRDEILKEYEVEPICCERDLIKLLGELAQHQLVELRHAPHFQIQTA